MDTKIPTTVDELTAAIAEAEAEETAAHDRAVTYRQCLRARVKLDAQRAEDDAALAERIAAAGKAS